MVVVEASKQGPGRATPRFRAIGEVRDLYDVEVGEEGSVEVLDGPVPVGAHLAFDADGMPYWARSVPQDEEERVERLVREATEAAASPWMDAERTAAHLALPSVEALYAHIARHPDFPRSRMGKRLLFNREEVDRHLTRPSTPRHRRPTVKPKVRAVPPTRGER